MEEKENDKEIKGIAKVVKKAIEVARFTKENWYILAVLVGMVWGTAKLYYYQYVEPEVRTYVTTIVYEMGKDSIPIMIHSELDTILSKRGMGYREQLSNETGVPKDSMAVEFGKVYRAYKSIDSLRKYVHYTNGVFKMLVNQFFVKYEHTDGAILYQCPSGDYYYFDVFGLLWDATYKASDNCFYYYPPYNNNERTKCRKLKEN